MKVIELTSGEELELLKYITDDKIEFLAYLQSQLENRNVILKLSNDFLRNLIMDCEYVFDTYNEYKIPVYKFRKIGFYINNIDLSNFNYDRLIIDQDSIAFMRKNNIVIDFDKLYKKELTDLIFSDCIINGSLDNFILNNVQITDCKDIKGKNIKINPQKIRNKELKGCYFSDIKFTGNFDNCDITSIRIENCENALINLNLLKNNSLHNCHFQSVKFTGNFDSYDISAIHLVDCKDVLINPQKVLNKDLSNVTIIGASFTDSLDNCILRNINIRNSKGLFAHAKYFYFNVMKYEKHLIDSMTLVVLDDEDLKCAKEEEDVNFISDDIIVCKLKYKYILERNYHYRSAHFKVEDYEYEKNITNFLDSFDKDIVPNTTEKQMVKSKNNKKFYERLFKK